MGYDLYALQKNVDMLTAESKYNEAIELLKKEADSVGDVTCRPTQLKYLTSRIVGLDKTVPMPAVYRGVMWFFLCDMFVMAAICTGRGLSHGCRIS
jgi:hypothetical protein